MNNDNSRYIRSKRRHAQQSAPVQILPGWMMMANHNSQPPPPPPLHEPIQPPSHLCKILVLGDRNVGKSSIVRRFLTRDYATISTSSRNKSGSSPDDRTANTNASMRKDDSLGTCKIIAAEYHKKDVTMWHRWNPQQKEQHVHERNDHDSYASSNFNVPVPDENDGGVEPQPEKEVCCTRVQIWDVTSSYGRNGDNDVSDFRTSPETTATDEWRKMFRKVGGIVIVCSLDPQQQCGSGEKLVELLESQIISWMNLICCYLSPYTATAAVDINENYHNEASMNSEVKRNQTISDFPTVTVLLNKADTIASTANTEFNHLNYIQLGARIDRLCRNLDISDWRICTCICPPTKSNENNMNNNTNDSFNAPPYDEFQEAVEQLFLNIIRRFVSGRRFSTNTPSFRNMNVRNDNNTNESKLVAPHIETEMQSQQQQQQNRYVDNISTHKNVQLSRKKPSNDDGNVSSLLHMIQDRLGTNRSPSTSATSTTVTSISRY